MRSPRSRDGRRPERNAGATLTDDLTDRTTDEIRRAITSGSIAPGARLTQLDLAQELGVSRTPIRKALERLKAERLIVEVGPKTVVVSPMNRQRLAEAFQVRIALEQLAIRLAVENVTIEILDRSRLALERIRQVTREQLSGEDIEEILEANSEFHRTVDSAVQNEYLLEMISQVRAETRRFSNPLLRQLYRQPGRAERELGEHRGILRALEERDADAAARLVATHLARSTEELLELAADSSHEGRHESGGIPARSPRVLLNRRLLTAGTD